MVEVITSIEILRPQDEVSQFVSDPDNAPKWYVNIKSAIWKTPKPLKIGSQIEFEAHFMGKKLVYTYEVIEKSSARFVMQTSQGPFPMQTIYEWQALGQRKTKMILTNKGNPSGFSKILAPFMTGMMRKANQKDLLKLKQLLERN
ncbi:MAG: SRPBCC family protein [Saprospiraceae bacterium]